VASVFADVASWDRGFRGRGDRLPKRFLPRAVSGQSALRVISGGRRTVDHMTDKLKGALITGTVVAALAVGGVAIAGAAGGGDDDQGERPIGGSALDRASAAALDHTGGGRVTETEAGDEESYYEVEVTRGDGSQVDVQLDREFQVVGSEDDGDRGDDDRGDDDDGLDRD
jgi:uncharacterized membrane protein YkoI